MANLSQLRSTHVSRCSLVVSPVDVWTRRVPAPSALSVTLAGVHQRPIRKSDGTYLFLDLPLGSYALTVTSPTFIPYQTIIETQMLPPLNPVVTVPLLPGSGYAYPTAATAIVFRLCDAAGAPVAHAEVEAYADEDAAARGRMSQDTLSPGTSSLAIGSVQGQTIAGESLLLRGQGKQELVRVAEALPGGNLRFEQPVAESYRRGALLLPAVVTRSTEDGTVLLPFRGTLPQAFTVKVSVRNGKRSSSAELTARAGQVITEQVLLLAAKK